MSSSDYTVTHEDCQATLSARIRGVFLPLVSSPNVSLIEDIYHSIQTGYYKNAYELCEDIRFYFSTQATVLVLATLSAKKPQAIAS